MQSRSSGPSHPLQSAFGASSRIAGLVERARKLALIDDLLRRSLPEPLASHVTMANYRDGRLIFLADSTLWAARLRLHHDDLLQAARTTLGVDDVKIAVKVAAPVAAPTETRDFRPLSAAAAEHLRAAARSMTDPELRDLFHRLASHASS